MASCNFSIRASPAHAACCGPDGHAYAIEFRAAENPDGAIETWRFSGVAPELRDAHPPFQVPRFDRSLAWWINAIGATDLRLEAAEEPVADPDTAARVPTVADTRIAPLFLILRARKPGP